MTEVAYRVCDKYGLNKDLMREVEMTIWGTHRYYLMRPEEVDYGINMPYLFKFIPKRHHLINKIKSGERKSTAKTKKFVDETNDDSQEQDWRTED